MIVVDASVAVKILSREPGSVTALDRVSAEDVRCAPDWIRLEVGSAMARKVREKAFTSTDAWAIAAGITSLVEDQVDSLGLMRDAFGLSVQLRHPMYDCLYLALGLRRQSVVLTADLKFSERAALVGYGAQVELLA